MTLPYEQMKFNRLRGGLIGYSSTETTVRQRSDTKETKPLLPSQEQSLVPYFYNIVTFIYIFVKVHDTNVMMSDRPMKNECTEVFYGC